MNIESRGGSLPQRSSDELRAQINTRQNIGHGFSPQAAHIQQLQEKLAEVQQQLEKETRRSQLFEQELAHLRSLTVQHTRHQEPAAFPRGAQQTAGRQQGKSADTSLPEHALKPQQRPRPHSIDGKPCTPELVETDRVQSAPAERGDVQHGSGNMDRAVRSALHAVSGAYVKEASRQRSSYMGKRQFPMSEAEFKAHQFIQQAQPVLLGETQSSVTISKQAFELLVLKDRAINAVKEGITIADCSLPDHPLIFANEAFTKITGYSTDEVVGKNCRFLQGPGTAAKEIQKMREAAAEGKPSVVQLLNYKKSGDPFINYLSITPIHDNRGQVTHFVGIQSDISDLVNHKKAELAAKHEAAQAAAATEVKSQFLARMSHEIRTPLNGMIAVGQLLAETVLSPAQWDLMNTIRCSGETLLTLITDILDFSRIEADKMVLQPTEFHLQTVIEAAMEIAGLHAAQKRLQVAYNVADNVPKLVTCDAQRLQQILLNVLNNAVKFTEKGEVLLEVWCEPPEDSNSKQEAQRTAADQSGSSSERKYNNEQVPYPSLDPRNSEQQTVLAPVCKDTHQLVDVASPRLDTFRPLTPDNLSQHTELAMVRQQLQGPLPEKSGQHAKSFGGCEGGGNCTNGGKCSCLPPHPEEQNGLVDGLAAPAGEVQVRSPEQHRQDLLTQRSHQQQQQQNQQQQNKQLQQQQKQQQQEQRRQQQQQPLNGKLGPQAGSGSKSKSFDSFVNAAPASTKQGQQRIIDASAASVNQSDRQRAEAASAGGVPEADRVAAEAAEERQSNAAAHKVHVGDSALQDIDRKEASQASSSGRSAEDAACYTLNFSVRDSGIGISPENVENLFQCFCQVDASPTRRFGGSGLGLSICKKLAEAMGGKMWVESDGLGQGSLFRWTLQARGHNCINCVTPQRNSTGQDRQKSVDDFATLSGSSNNSSRSSGARQLQQSRSSAEWRRNSTSGSVAGSTVESALALFSGKKVLLVEVCDMVRQVLSLALRRWGFQVCAVKNEADAIQKLRLREGHSDFLAACKARAEGQLKLEHSYANLGDDKMCDADGPFDVVVLDMALSQLVLALMQGVEEEASTLVFLGWPGQNEPEEDALQPPVDCMPAALSSPLHSQGSACYKELTLGSGAISAQMSQDTADKMSNGPIGSKQLMYAIVTRPVRQGRLKLALEEVLSSQPNPADPAPLQSPDETQPAIPAATSDSSTSSTAAVTQSPRISPAESAFHSAQPLLADGDSLGHSPPLGPGWPYRALQEAPSDPPCLHSRPSQMVSEQPSLHSRPSQMVSEQPSLHSRPSQMSSGQLSNGSEASGGLQPWPSDLSRHQVSSPAHSHGTDMECASQARRASLHRAPKLKGHGSFSELGELDGSRRFLKVLLAEDNLINMKVALGILKRTGYSEVTTVVDGQQAMDELHRRGGADAFDIILTDLHMPHKGGMEMVTEIRQLWPNSRVRVVAVTADAFEDRRDQCLASGFDGWLAKPFRVEDLVKIMEAVS